MRPLRKSWYNSLSSAVTILALEAYAGNGGSLPEHALELAAVGADGKAAPFGATEGQVQRGTFDGSAQALNVRNAQDQTAWYSLATAGYARAVPTGELKEGFEVQREYRDAKGKAVTTVELGDEVEVHLRVRATRPDGVNYVALVDLLPGGFEPVQEPSIAPEADAVEPPPSRRQTRARPGRRTTPRCATTASSCTGTSDPTCASTCTRSRPRMPARSRSRPHTAKACTTAPSWPAPAAAA
jgi:uncharacterized protein YfaS (alpha-2-macroglobulin family)